MSWGEVLKAINNDPNKSLDELIKEQFELSNNSMIKQTDINNIKEIVNYIKTTQLGTSLDSYLSSASFSSSFSNTSLVSKINAILIANTNIKYSSSGTTTFSTGNFTAKYSGAVLVSCNAKYTTDVIYYSAGSGSNIAIIPTGTAGYRQAFLSVTAGTYYGFTKTSGITDFKITGSYTYTL